MLVVDGHEHRLLVCLQRGDSGVPDALAAAAGAELQRREGARSVWAPRQVAQASRYHTSPIAMGRTPLAGLSNATSVASSSSGRCGSLPLSMALSRRRMASHAASLLFAAAFTTS
jgi:hypothetical protein